MAINFKAVFAALKSVFSKQAKHLSVKTDTATEYTLVTKRPSPFPQHKGQPMYFASVRLGKAYVSFHLMPLYMCPPLTQTISPALKKRMQGKTCFNFKSDPEPELGVGQASWPVLFTDLAGARYTARKRVPQCHNRSDRPCQN